MCLVSVVAASASARIDAGELRRDLADLSAEAAAKAEAASGSAGGQDKVDFSVIEKIRAEGMERSKAVETFEYLTTNIGPRLTNSPAHKQAIAWTQQTLKALGHERGACRAVPVRPRVDAQQGHARDGRAALHAAVGYPRGWSPATAGRIVATPVWMPGLEDAAMKAQAGKLKGAILFTQPDAGVRDSRRSSGGERRSQGAVTRAGARPPQLNAERLAMLKAEGVGRDHRAEHRRARHGLRHRPRHGRQRGAVDRPGVGALQPVAKMLQQKIPVKLAVEIQATYNEDDRNTHNVICEIPGTDNAVKDEIVMVGAHLDSWHTATGATDNADGSATVMEAMRILKALNVRPRRTIRGALWAGEEQGLLGSKAYVAQHLAGDKNKAARDKFSVYFNLDNGFPPISGFYMEGNEPARVIMAEWLKPVARLGAIMPSPGHIGATDHLSFLEVGVPGFQAVQEYVNYDVRTHHTNVDFAERIDPNALKQASTVMAVVLYQAAMREGTFPKPPPAKKDSH